MSGHSDQAPLVPGTPARGLTIRAYAAHRRGAGLPGGSKRAVEIALKSGRITRNEYGKIDPARADAAWLANSPGSRPVSQPAPRSDVAVGLCQLAAAVERLAAAIEGARTAKFRGAALQDARQRPIGVPPG